jgi:hypothetical protein
MARKFDVVVSPVREVTLVGRADLSYWRRNLAVHGLHPTDANGNAEILLSSCEARFKGIRFRELSLSVFVTQHAGGRTRDGAFLLRAFNSIRFFAFVERAMFRTPYYPQQVALDPQVPAFMRLGDAAQPVLHAVMSKDAATSARNVEPAKPDGWQGPLFLPDLRSPQASSPRLFYGSLTGDTQTIAYDAAADTFELGSIESDPIVPILIESQFAPHEWILRAAATHGKSKTIKRIVGEEFAEFVDGRPR